MMNADDVEALRLEYSMMVSPGWATFKATATEKFQEDSAKLTFGSYTDDVQRKQAEGRCQFFKWICDHEAAIRAAWEALQEDLNQRDEEFEGGDLGINYEAAQ